MPNSPLPNTGAITPVDHGDADIWGSIWNAVAANYDAHDHTTGKGLPVTSAALKINGDVAINFGGTHYALTDALAFDMFPTTAASVAAYSSALFVNSADNNLYFRNSGGTNVQIIAGNSLNFSVTGGFGGDYAAVGALASFTDASDLYTFQQQIGSAVRQYARVAHGDLDLFEYKAQPAAGVPTNRVRQKSPAALAASYDLTWLTALPAANTLLMVDNTGAVTAPANPTLSANANIKLQGTGYIQTSTRTASVPVLAGMAKVGAGGSASNVGGASYGVTVSAGGDIYIPIIGVENLQQLQSLSFHAAVSAGAGNVTYTLVVGGISFGALTPVAGAVNGPLAGVTGNFTLTPSTPALLPSFDSAYAGNNYWLQVTTTATLQITIWGVFYTYTTP